MRPSGLHLPERHGGDLVESTPWEEQKKIIQVLLAAGAYPNKEDKQGRCFWALYQLKQERLGK